MGLALVTAIGVLGSSTTKSTDALVDDLITADSIDEAAAFMAKHPTAILGRIYILPMVKLPWDQD